MIDPRKPNLEAYRRKRDPERTPEPFGGGAAAGGSHFVVHEHAARNLHYDLRLELDGTLKSWAIPKGPSVRAEEKRLAVHVEDHPLEYGDFEGIIPAGNYGAGSVIVWDRGWYRSFKPEPLDEQYVRGKLELELFGYKLRGRWTLVRMSRKEKEWLLLKKADGAASDVEATERHPYSVLSGLTVREMADPSLRHEAIARALEASGARAGEVRARGQAPMLATLEPHPFTRDGWLFEIKYDGVRVLAERRGEVVTLLGRSGQDVTRRYPEVSGALAHLPAERFLIDGEIVAHDATGRPSFQRLQARMGLTNPHDIARAMAQVPVTAVFFDCLALEGRDLRRAPLAARKACLKLLVPPLGPTSYGDHVEVQGEAFFESADALGLEGIVAKRADSPYAGGRSRDWVKIKCQRRQEFVIGGWTAPRGGRAHFGALYIGLYDGARLKYVSRVGTGLDGNTIESVWNALQPLRRDTSPFDAGSPTGAGNGWVEPRLVCEVRFTEWTKDGGLRHPTFLGLRGDKRPEDCRREEPAAAPESVREAPTPAAPPSVAAPAASRRVRLTNLDKVFWPASGHTKGDLIAYYDAIAPLLLPYLADRPMFLTRYPDGIEGKSFYQKDAPVFVPDWVRTETVYSKDSERDIRYFIVEDAETLRYIANLGAIPLHMWGSRIGSLDRPDWLILDFDPKGAPFADVVRVARALAKLLRELELPSYVKTSGASGLHLLIPLGAKYTYEECRSFARLLAMMGAQAMPDIATVARPIQAREGKVYIDWGQNGHGQTIVAPFSVRPLPGAPASCPLRWSEVTARLAPSRHTIETIPKRFQKMKDPLAPVLHETIDMVAAIESLRAKLG